MDLDWAIAILVFLVFVTWGFSFYFSLFQEGSSQVLSTAADTVRDDILDYLRVETYKIPVRFESGSSYANAVLKFNYDWPFGKNTTRVYSGASSLDCQFSGDILYWETNLSAGDNYFHIKLANLSETLNCDSSFNTSGSNETTPWVMEEGKRFSQSRIDKMTNTSYGRFRKRLGIKRNFRIELNQTGNLTTYGPALPKASPVESRESSGRMWPGDEEIDFTVMVW